MTYTITIDCYDGKLTVWHQEKENMKPEHKQQLNELLREVKELASRKNAEIIHQPKAEEVM